MSQGRCASCKQRNAEGYCMSPKIIEYAYRNDFPEPGHVDSLVYDYEEGGGFWVGPEGEGFWVGPEFGCVHWEQA